MNVCFFVYDIGCVAITCWIPLLHFSACSPSPAPTHWAPRLTCTRCGPLLFGRLIDFHPATIWLLCFSGFQHIHVLLSTYSSLFKKIPKLDIPAVVCVRLGEQRRTNLLVVVHGTFFSAGLTRLQLHCKTEKGGGSLSGAKP